MEKWREVRVKSFTGKLVYNQRGNTFHGEDTPYARVSINGFWVLVPDELIEEIEDEDA